MSLENKQQLPDIYIGEMLEYIRILNKKDRTTSGNASYTNTDTSANYTTVGTIYEDKGETGLGLLLYNLTPALKNYFFGIEDYMLLKAQIDSLTGGLDNWVTPVANNRVMINELQVFYQVQSQVKQSDSVFFDFAKSDIGGVYAPKSSGLVDKTKAYASTITQGNDNLVVDTMLEGVITDFKVGQEATLQDGGNKEDLIVSEVQKNLFDKTKATLDTFVQTDGAIGISGSGNATSGFINVSEISNMKLSGSPTFARAGYYTEEDVNTFISFEGGSDLTIPTNANYVIFTFKGVDIDTVQLEKGTIPTSYVPFNTIEFTTNIQNTYSSGANLYRSNIKTDDNDDSMWEFGDFSSETEVDVSTPLQVINANYQTNKNARPQYMADNSVVISAKDVGNNRLKHFKIENGTTVTELDFDNFFDQNGFATVRISDDRICEIRSVNNDTVTYTVIDTTTGLRTTFGNIDSGQTSIGEMSLAVSDDGTKIIATWHSTNATYPNSDNIREIRGTISNGVITWGSVTQVTTFNVVGQDENQPSVIYMENGQPCIVTIQYSGAGNPYYVIARPFDGVSTWGQEIIYNGGIYAQANPSIDKLSDGTLVLGWHGFDSTDVSNPNIRFSQSTDNGLTWSATEKLTTGNTTSKSNVSITRDKNDEIYLVYEYQPQVGFNSVIGYIQGTSGNFGTVQNIEGDGTVAGFGSPSALNNYRDFTSPITVYEAINEVSFYGVWIEGSSTPLTDVDVRLNIVPYEQIDFVKAWMYSNIISLSAITPTISFHNEGADESFVSMTSEEVLIDGSDKYTKSQLKNASLTDKATLKYNLTRDNVGDNFLINRIQGAVA